FPDLPILEEVYEMLNGEPPSGPDYEAFSAFNAAAFSAQKVVILPEGTPPDIVEAWRQTWRDIFADPQYQARVDAVLGSYGQVTDRAAEALFVAGTTIDPEVRHHVLEMLENEYSVRLSGN